MFITKIEILNLKEREDMKKEKILGVVIPYYVNNDICEVAFKELMEKISKQMKDNIYLVVYEDGQASSWLSKYLKDIHNMILLRDKVNKGLSHARNKCIDQLQTLKVDYILFLDSDDLISDNYLSEMYEFINNGNADIYESRFFIGKSMEYQIPFRETENRYSVTGQAFKSSLIGKNRFDETIQIGEDTEFMNRVVDPKKIKKILVGTADYIYNLGLNRNSLTMLFQRGLIGERR